MYIIGIDIGKNHHEASIVDAVGNPIGHSLRFPNTYKGADKLMAYIEKYIPNKPCIFGMPSFLRQLHAPSTTALCTPTTRKSVIRENTILLPSEP